MARSSTTYTSKWKSGETKVLRVPEVLADKVLAYAQELDQKSAYSEVRENQSPYLISTNKRLDPSRPVNVASVPLRSPFRYPGGKTWLVPYVRSWLLSKTEKPFLFLEPFAGGGICSLTVAFERLAGHVIMGEMDEYVSSVWKTILDGQAEWLALRILAFELTLDNVKKALSKDMNCDLILREQAFLTILRNRVQRGGIMAPGAGLVKSGEDNRGISSRWYAKTLARRIREIVANKHMLTFVQGDGMALIREHRNDPQAVFFVDPPYTKAARRLYRHWEFDHQQLFVDLSMCKGDFLVSYDDTDEIRALTEKFELQWRAVSMKSTHHATKRELLIGRDSSWLDAAVSHYEAWHAVPLRNFPS